MAIPIGVWLDVLGVTREDVPSTGPCTWHANPGVYCRLVGLPSVVYDATALCAGEPAEQRHRGTDSAVRGGRTRDFIQVVMS